MNRIWASHASVIGEALDYLPERFRAIAGCDFFCGDALFAGISRPEWTQENGPTGCSYRTTAHCCFPYHVRDGRTTVVLPPKCPGLSVVIHEIGHALHWSLYERAGRMDALPRLDVVSDYARTNNWETFAEAFLAWFYPPKLLDAMPYWHGYSRGNDEFFNRLGR